MDCETDCLANGVSLSVLTVTIQSMTDVVSFFFFYSQIWVRRRFAYLFVHLASTDLVMIASLDPPTSVRICHTCRSFSQLVNPRFLGERILSSDLWPHCAHFICVCLSLPHRSSSLVISAHSIVVHYVMCF